EPGVVPDLAHRKLRPAGEELRQQARVVRIEVQHQDDGGARVRRKMAQELRDGLQPAGGRAYPNDNQAVLAGGFSGWVALLARAGISLGFGVAHLDLRAHAEFTSGARTQAYASRESAALVLPRGVPPQ